MPILTLMLKEKKISDFKIAVGQNVTIGRKTANDITIDYEAVSSFHAKVESVASTFVLRDLDSTNGTFVNNERTNQHNLKHQDVILIGKYELIFDRSDLMKATEKEPDPIDDDKTQILDTRAYKVYRKEMHDQGEQSNAGSFWSRLWKKFFG